METQTMVESSGTQRLVYEKLQQARMMLQDTKMKKSGHNKFAGYDYFELGDFLPEINRIFSKLHLCSVVSFGKELATLTIVDTIGGGEIVFTSPMAEANLKGCHPIQNLGAVETYSRRYLYVTALEIVEHDALDSAPPVGNPGIKEGVGVHKATDGARDRIDNTQREKVDRVLSTIVYAFDAGQPQIAYQAYDTANMDADEKTYLWSKLDSKQRATLKKIDESKKVTKQETANA